MPKSMESIKYSGNEAITKLHNRLFAKTAFLAFLRALTALSFIVGIIIIILRQLQCFSHATIWIWIVSSFVLAIIYGIYFAISHNVSKSACIAAIDAENSAGGLLMSENELSDNSWKTATKALYTIPEIKINYSNELLLCVMAIAFAVSCCLVPLINLKKADRKINLTNKIAEIQDKVELLEKQEIITPEEKKQLNEELDKIVENSDKSAPGITFEALDQLNEKLCHEAASEIKKRISNNELLKKIENFAKEAKESQAAKEGKAKELLEQLKNILRQSGMNEDQINDYLKQQFGGSNVEGGISPEQIEKYAEQLGSQAREKLQEAAEIAKQMAEQKLIPQELAEQLAKEAANNQQQGSQQNGSQNAGMDGQGEGNLVAVPQGNECGKEGNCGGNQNGQECGNGNDASGNGQSDNSAGSGGISKGDAGKTPLTFGDKASDYNAKYHDEVLPETKLESAVDAVSMGIGVSAPQTDSENSKTNSVDINANSIGNKSGNRNVLPKYRNTVRNYFSK